MTYQDVWLRGRVVRRGYRECASRYALIREFCGRFQRPFSVCDIGANMCYFGLRLTEDFEDCTVVAFEFDHFKMRLAYVEENRAGRLLLLERKLNLEDLRVLSACAQFDVVLALSVLHHVTRFEEWLQALCRLGDNLIVELAGSDSKRTASRPGYRIPEGVVLGHGKSHLGEYERPILVIPGTGRRP